MREDLGHAIAVALGLDRNSEEHEAELDGWTTEVSPEAQFKLKVSPQGDARDAKKMLWPAILPTRIYPRHPILGASAGLHA